MWHTLNDLKFLYFAIGATFALILCSFSFASRRKMGVTRATALNRWGIVLIAVGGGILFYASTLSAKWLYGAPSFYLPRYCLPVLMTLCGACVSLLGIHAYYYHQTWKQAVGRILIESSFIAGGVCVPPRLMYEMVATLAHAFDIRLGCFFDLGRMYLAPFTTLILLWFVFHAVVPLAERYRLRRG